MWAKNKQYSGFTIVELLIVIVVIGILAALVLNSFSVVQAKARDNTRYADAKAIMKALELYKADHGTYPLVAGANHTNAAICASHNNGYSYSDATDGTWLKTLVDNKYLSKAPISPNNGCVSHYRYLFVGATSYNCPSRTTDYYVLAIEGTERAITPPDISDPSDGSNWRPCESATAGWGGGSNSWVFVREDI